MAQEVMVRVIATFFLTVALIPHPCYGNLKSNAEENYKLLQDVQKEYDEWVERMRQSTRDFASDGHKKLGYDNINSLEGLDRNLRRAENRKKCITVSQDGHSDFTTITDAIQSIEINDIRRTIIFIKGGIYREKILVPKGRPFVTFLGDIESQTTITGNETASLPGADGKPLHTFNTATVAVESSYFIAHNIRFENTAPLPTQGSGGGQAVALRVSGTKAAFCNCSFYGKQDTLYDHSGLHYFKDCFIQGSMDFIFGYGRSLYENCYLNSVAQSTGAVTAQKRSQSTSMLSGFSFVHCTISGSGLVYLGRAWGDHSRVVFAYTYMHNVVIPQGWSDSGIPLREKTVYYGEYKCSGPGSKATERVRWVWKMTEHAVKPFLTTSFISAQRWLLYNDNSESSRCQISPNN